MNTSLSESDSAATANSSHGMEVTVENMDGRRISFRASRRFASEKQMIEEFVAIHSESIAREGWVVLASHSATSLHCLPEVME